MPYIRACAHKVAVYVAAVGFCCALSYSADAIVNKSMTPSASWDDLGTVFKPREPINGISDYKSASRKWGQGSAEWWLWCSQSNLMYREGGLVLWQKLPDDPRKYAWLASTVWDRPIYWVDPNSAVQFLVNKQRYLMPRDREKEERWKAALTVMRAELIASASVSLDQKADFMRCDLFVRIDEAKLAALRGDAVDWMSLIQEYANLMNSPEYAPQETWSVGMANVMLQGINAGAYSACWEDAFLQTLVASKNDSVRKFGVGRSSVQKTRSDPIQFQWRSMDGQKLSSSDFRGKVVLIDVWSNNCTNCIDSMPKLQETYAKYKNRGFEVLGVWLGDDTIKSLQKAKNILSQQGAGWQNAVLTGKGKNDFIAGYGIAGVPVTWLLDERGLLVGTDLSDERLEQELARRLQPEVLSEKKTESVDKSSMHPAPLGTLRAKP